MCWGADLQKGKDAYKRGDYATALKEWTPLTEQGHALAQTGLGLMYANGHGVISSKPTEHASVDLQLSESNRLTSIPFDGIYCLVSGLGCC